jgi:hypothetical protein
LAVAQLLEEAHSVETYVRSIVQARINEKGNYGKFIRLFVNVLKSKLTNAFFFSTELKLPKDLPSGTTLEPIVKD